MLKNKRLRPLLRNLTRGAEIQADLSPSYLFEKTNGIVEAKQWQGLSAVYRWRL